MNFRTLRSSLFAGTLAVCVAAGAAPAFAAGPSATAAPAAPAQQSPSWSGGDYDYYLALGDSLAWGTQSSPSGVEIKSGHGYADDLAAYLRRQGDRRLKFVDLACPGETTGTMLDGGCPDLAGSGQSYQVQETAAIAFLKAHPHSRILVTLDIGANNVDGCVNGTSLDESCIEEGIGTAATQLPEVLAGLESAAGKHVRFVGMNLYDPFLAAWLSGGSGQTLAEDSAELSTQYNGVLDSAFAAAKVPVADVSSAFKTTDFTDTATLDGATLPVNVVNICNWTWMCAPAPAGPDIHANTAGYAVIAKAFEPLVRESRPRH